MNLSLEQEQQVEVIFIQMNTEAKQVGREIVESERQLSDVFAQGEISESDIRDRTQQIAALYGQYRAIHLQPHLKVRQLLSAEQVSRYNQLRGYDNSHQSEPDSPAHH